MAENPTWALAIEGFEIEQVEYSELGWLIHARSTQDEHRCPCCGVVTRHVHSLSWLLHFIRAENILKLHADTRDAGRSAPVS